ncbi:MAG: PAS domain-containing protein [Acidobacteria bacterium]|nr:PAS domain-containing protein [Acidobacteriota bacterium]
MTTPIERKFLSYLSIILAVLIILVFLVYHGVRTMTDAGDQVKRTLVAEDEIAELSSQIYQVGEMLREYYLTEDPRLLDKYAELKEQLSVQVARVKTSTADNRSQQERLDKLQGLLDQHLNMLELMVRSRQREEYDVARRLIRGEEMPRIREEISRVINQMEGEEQRLYAERSGKQSTFARFAAAVAVIGILVASALLVLTGVSMHREIAKQMEGEQKLREREKELRLAVSSSNAGLWFWDLDSKQVTWSDENYEVFGFKPGDCLPSYELWTDCFHPEDRERVERELETALADKQNFKTEHRILWANGEVRRILVKGQTEYDPAGRPRRMSGINIDVTEHRAAEEALYESEERFRQIAENIDAVLWIRNAQTGQLEFISSGIERLWGISAENLMSNVENWSDYIHPADREEATKPDQEKFTNGNMDQEYRIITADGKLKWVRDRAFTVKDRYGKVRRIVGFTVDTTERKQSEDVKARLLAREQEARAQAETANRTKDDFLAIVSHELRSPLNAMLGWARVLRSDVVDLDTQDQAVRVIEQSAEMQSRLIEDLLDSARIASGQLRIESRPVNLIPAILNAVDTVHPTAESKGVEIETDLDLNAGIITGDPMRLQQIVWNLLSNAVKFTPKGGSVDVKLSRQDPWITITVKDTGRGIKAAELPYIFDRFRQADSSSTRRAGGLGLGLSLVKNLVELHGGKIMGESDGEGKGATFTINLPLRAVSSAETEPTRESKEPTSPLSFPPVLSGLCILTVDDEAQARDLVATLLSKYGATVTPVSSSAEAMDVLTRFEGGKKFDLIVSDIGMPDENGYTLIRRIRKLPDPVGKIPAVALTAFGRSEDRINALEAGFQMHVPKPVEPTELMIVIASLTGRSMKIPVE